MSGPGVTDTRWSWDKEIESRTLAEWLDRAADPKYTKPAEKALRDGKLLRWLEDQGEGLDAERVMASTSLADLLKWSARRDSVPDFPNDQHVQDLLSSGAELYRVNAFRLTGLPVTASSRDIARHLEKLKVQEKLGTQSATAAGPLPLNPPPDFDAIRSSVQGLTKDPEMRLLYEYLWFWPLEGKTPDGSAVIDDALQALTQGDVEGAVKRWEDAARSPRSGPNALHNLAVLYHAAALDLEHKGQGASRSAEQDKQFDLFWGLSLKSWAASIAQESSWSWVSGRIRSLADARLTTGYVRRMRDFMPTMLAAISAKLAGQAEERGDPAEARRYLRSLVGSGMDPQVIESALSLIVNRYRERIRTPCTQAEESRDSNPIRADQSARTLLDQAVPILNAIDKLTMSGSPVREAVHDHVADCLFKCAMRYENTTQNYKVSGPLLEEVLALARGESVRKEIADELEATRRILESGNYWCGEGYFELPDPVLVILEKARAAANNDQHDAAISLLVGLLTGKDGVVLTTQQKPLVRRSLAWCLSRRSVRRYNAATGGNLLEALMASAEDIQLAAELDAANKETQKHVKTLKEYVANAGLRWPTTQRLRASLRLGGDLAQPKTQVPQQRVEALAPAAQSKDRGIADSAPTALKSDDTHIITEPAKPPKWRKLRFIAATVALSVLASVGLVIGNTFYKANQGELVASVQLYKWSLISKDTLRDALNSVMKSPDPTRRKFAVQAWGDIASGPLAEARFAIPELLRTLKAGQEDSRASAASILGEVGRLDKQNVTQGLVEALDDESWPVRENAAIALGAVALPDAVPGLTHALSDPNVSVRVAAAIALGAIALPDAVPGLIHALSDPNVSVRVAAVKSLAKMGPLAKSAVPKLKLGLKNEPKSQDSYHRAIQEALPKIQEDTKVAKSQKSQPKMVDQPKLPVPEKMAVAPARVEPLEPSDDDMKGMEPQPAAPQSGDVIPTEKPRKAHLKLPNSPVVSKKMEPENTQPDFTQQTSQTEDVNQEPDEEFTKIRKIELPTPVPLEVSPKPAPQVETKVPSVKAVDARLTVSGTAPRPNSYWARVQSIISNQWEPPSIDLAGQTYTVIVKFRLHRNGTIKDVVVLQSSGNAYFDISGQRAVLRPRVLPPFPADMTDSYQDVEMIFRIGGSVG